MQKPLLGFWQIFNMSFGFFGIQMAFALQGANVSRIFQTLGADVSNLAIYWLAGPVTGLLVQPLIGHFSDRTWGPLGRRRPYFLAGAVLSTLSLFIMPHSPYLWAGVVMLWVLDASINVSMEPFRAFVGDMLPSRQRTQGFATQTILIGAGAALASAMPNILTEWFGVATTAAEGVIPDSVKYSFYIGGIAMFIAVGWTILSTREYSPEQLASFDKEESKDAGRSETAEPQEKSASYFIANAVSLLMVFALGSFAIYRFDMAPELYVLTVTAGLLGSLFLVHAIVRATVQTIRNTLSLIFLVLGAGLIVLAIMQAVSTPPNPGGQSIDPLARLLLGLTSGGGGLGMVAFGILVRPPADRNIVSHIMTDLVSMPKVMQRLAVVQFFSWFSLFIMWVYTTPAITAHQYGSSDPTSEAYNQGANWVGTLFSTYNGVSAVWAIALVLISARINRRFAHGFSLSVGAASYASLYFISDPSMLLIPMIGIGMAWGSILTMPYAILSDALPAKKMGIYMGIFNFFIVLPQMIVAGVMGPILTNFLGGQAILTFFIAAASWLIATLALFLVPGKPRPSA
ncbi:MAG: MFS transporter [Maricaulis sp.]|uniref:MFS transporter n=1 Tax=Maricaulis sp. TaxID=1486257 RepID=UPI001B2AB6D2|nr:MFS transporter [Maricaulis sp.]MBO6730064.1 MFS transporter [Maricaulis sp.]MBO6846988.1 MFS transporter [Maricaulis sp.]MBO6876347.1 MFS transporter [Maricaulis sp.]